MADYEDRVKVFKALTDERRQKILELLQKGKKSASELAEKLDIPQSSLSYHMKILCESGLVIRQEDGKWTYYQIDPCKSKRAMTVFEEIVTDYAENFHK